MAWVPAGGVGPSTTAQPGVSRLFVMTIIMQSVASFELGRAFDLSTFSINCERHLPVIDSGIRTISNQLDSHLPSGNSVAN